MYLAINTPCNISTLGVIILLNASCAISQLLKCTGSPPPPTDALTGPSDP